MQKIINTEPIRLLKKKLFQWVEMNRFSSVLIRKVRPTALRFATTQERIDGLSTNLSILGKSKGNAPITIDCIDLHQHPSADVALFELDPMHSRAQERRFDSFSKLFITNL